MTSAQGDVWSLKNYNDTVKRHTIKSISGFHVCLFFDIRFPIYSAPNFNSQIYDLGVNLSDKLG